MSSFKPWTDQEIQAFRDHGMDRVADPTTRASISALLVTVNTYRMALHRATGDLCWEPDECPRAVHNWAASPCRGGSCPLPEQADHGSQSRLCWAEYYLRVDERGRVPR